MLVVYPGILHARLAVVDVLFCYVERTFFPGTVWNVI